MLALLWRGTNRPLRLEGLQLECCNAVASGVSIVLTGPGCSWTVRNYVRRCCSDHGCWRTSLAIAVRNWLCWLWLNNFKSAQDMAAPFNPDNAVKFDMQMIA